jgi:hypothetical protein
MSLLCNLGGQRNCACKTTSTAGATTNGCAVTCPEVAAVTNPEPRPIKALLNYVLDSCCTTEDICREITIECPHIFDPDDLEVGSFIDVEIPSDVTFKEVNRNKDDCVCLSSVRFVIPIRLFGNKGHHGCGCKFLDREICVIRSANLCCTTDSVLQAFNSKVLSVTAVISHIEFNQITICLCILFRSCLQQIALREFCWEATPVCTFCDCNDTRRSLLDSCDTLCGCTESGAKICPSCS